MAAGARDISAPDHSPVPSPGEVSPLEVAIQAVLASAQRAGANRASAAGEAEANQGEAAPTQSVVVAHSEVEEGMRTEAAWESGSAVADVASASAQGTAEARPASPAPVPADLPASAESRLPRDVPLPPCALPAGDGAVPADSTVRVAVGASTGLAVPTRSAVGAEWAVSGTLPSSSQPSPHVVEVEELSGAGLEPPRQLEIADARAAGATLPNLRQPLSEDLEEEFAQALAGQSVEELIAGSTAAIQRGALEPQSQHTGRVVAVGREDVFVELGGREQGSVPLRLFEQPPEPGSPIEVVVERFDPEEGLYQLSLPQKPVEVDDWGDLREGMLVEARVTGHNSGGLECQVHNLRAFIPASQVALFRIENLQEYVGQTLTCVVTEAHRQRRRLVLSRRAVLEREREQAKQELLASLQPGQLREGVVRRLADFGAFVDLGGVDGLLHVSQMAWYRVQHPSEMLSEGQRIQVRIEKVDSTTQKISLSYRDLQENPWAQAAAKFPPQSVVRGKVTKLMAYGAFVELERGIEGLVHISELSHKRVWRVSDVVKEGDEVEVLVLAVDPQAQRISLSMKALAAPPQPAKTEPDALQQQPADATEQPLQGAGSAATQQPKAKPGKTKPEKPLLGGLDRPAKGHGFGLKW